MRPFRLLPTLTAGGSDCRNDDRKPEARLLKLAQPRPTVGSPCARFAARLKRAGRCSRYRFGKQVVEPVFGHMKQARGFRQFLTRGLDQVRGEWAMICTAQPPEAGSDCALRLLSTLGRRAPIQVAR